jgi:hypothetical protein
MPLTTRRDYGGGTLTRLHRGNLWGLQVKVKVTLRPTVSQSSGTRDQFFFLLEIFFQTVAVCYFVAPSLTRGRVCNLLLLLVLASTVPLGSALLTRGQACFSVFCQYQSIVSRYVYKIFTLSVFDTVQGSIYNIYKASLKVKAKVMLRLTIGQSVSQYVLVSSSLWNLWPDIIFGLKVAVMSLWGTLCDERSGLSPVSHCHQRLVHCQRFNIIYIVHVTCFKYMQYILDLCQHRLSTADHANI